jgi:hypothetical protein
MVGTNSDSNVKISTRQLGSNTVNMNQADRSASLLTSRPNRLLMELRWSVLTAREATSVDVMVRQTQPNIASEARSSGVILPEA